MLGLSDLKVKLFTDGADKTQILEMAAKPWIKGFTTNPSLLKKAGVSDYAAYARDLVAAVPDRHISFEVFSDDIPEMVAQARVITAWGRNVHIKLPVTTTRGEPLYEAVRALSREGVKVNMTAIFAPEQVGKAVDALAGGAPACVSVFAGRLADLGIDYRPVMQEAVARARQTPNVEIIWASTREVFNVVEADMMGCHIITAPADVLKKLPALGRRALPRGRQGVPRGCAGDRIDARGPGRNPGSRVTRPPEPQYSRSKSATQLQRNCNKTATASVAS
jgi:transaldolase